MQRASGILLHPTALPGPHGIGSLGSHAFHFINFLVEAGQSVWQVLPLGPTGYGNSPYNALSAFAGNPILIDLDKLVILGDLLPEEAEAEAFAEGFVTNRALLFKRDVLKKAGCRFLQHGDPERRASFDKFCRDQADWLEDYALFMALREHFKECSWSIWPDELRHRDPSALETWRKDFAFALDQHRYQQFIFFEQWFALKSYANQRGIRIFGDIPIFVAYDSADVWAHQEFFQLDDNCLPTSVAGVPPDYFSATGQRWGNPLYRWSTLQETGFKWWLERFHYNLNCTDMVRIDHFRGFQACWSIPVKEETAVNGHWEEVPGRELFNKLRCEHPDLPIIAEDLGVITPEVEALRESFGFPGMKILQFAFDSGPDNPYLPHNYGKQCVVYTGTHDNNTTLGWWHSLTKKQRQVVEAYLDRKKPDMPWTLIETAEMSLAQLCILPCQDILALGTSARFNTPGQAKGNWAWRLKPGQLNDWIASRLKRLCIQANRIPENIYQPLL